MMCPRISPHIVDLHHTALLVYLLSFLLSSVIRSFHFRNAASSACFGITPTFPVGGTTPSLREIIDAGVDLSRVRVRKLFIVSTNFVKLAIAVSNANWRRASVCATLIVSGG